MIRYRRRSCSASSALITAMSSPGSISLLSGSSGRSRQVVAGPIRREPVVGAEESADLTVVLHWPGWRRTLGAGHRLALDGHVRQRAPHHRHVVRARPGSAG